MTKRLHKRTCNKLRKFRKSKSKLTKRMRNKIRNIRMFSKKRGRVSRGGYGKGACPFIGAPWNGTGKAYYFKHIKDGISPGGNVVYPGNHSPSPQQGGNFLQPAINLFRVGEVGGKNVLNKYKGVKLIPSPLPMYDQLKRRMN